jgi:hypothetical protein
LAQHELDTWRDFLESEMLREKPVELQQWLEFGTEAVQGALAAAASQLDTAGDRVVYADRLTKLRETVWDCLGQMRDRSGLLPPGNGVENLACEMQSTIVRFATPRPGFYSGGSGASRALLSDQQRPQPGAHSRKPGQSVGYLCSAVTVFSLVDGQSDLAPFPR